MRRVPLLSALTSGSIAIAALFAAADASADPTQVGLYSHLDLSATWLPPTRLGVDPTLFGSRKLQGSLAPLTSTALVGASMGFGASIGKHFTLPLFDIGYSSALGGYREQEGALDGSIVHQRPWSTAMLDLSFGGLGYRTTYRRWQFSGTVVPGLTQIFGGADAAYGGNTYELDPNRAFFYLRAELSACRRFEPRERMCLVVTPNVVQDGFFQGGSIGLRYEVGK